MLDGIWILLTLSTVMAIASFLAGSLPLSLTLSQSQLRLVSTIGMGVLVGTSLIVIIPEGIETLYSAGDVAHSHKRRQQFSQTLNVRWQDSSTLPKVYYRRDDTPSMSDFGALPGPVIPNDLDMISGNAPPKTPIEPGEIRVLDSGPSNPAPVISTPHKSSRSPHAWVGISLILGFILMYLIDTLPNLAPSSPQPTTLSIFTLSDLSTSSPTSPSHTVSSPSRSAAITLGLCIHALADGIALGASSTTTSTKSFSFMIFLAIMIHKAPAAFGLTSVLLKKGVGKRAARAHLVVFSLAAPVGAVGTWMLIRLLGLGSIAGSEGGEEHRMWWTGVLLLFSGGTFLYVAMHTMQEEGSGGHEEIHGNGYLDGGLGRENTKSTQRTTLPLTMAAVGGMLLPMITQIGHAH